MEFTRCDLARELKRQGFPIEQLPNWVCLIESESSRKTDAMNKSNVDGSWDWGLFQINDRYWCGRNDIAGDCNVKCSDLAQDDITAAARCAKKIFSVHGFSAWEGWKQKCDGKTLPDLSECNL